MCIGTIIIIIIIIKWIYIAQDQCTKFSRKTVTHRRSLDSDAAVTIVCYGAWNSQSAGVSGSKTPAGDC